MKEVIIFGSSGSIGKSTLDVIRKDKKNFKVIGLCVYNDIKTIFSQIREFSPKYVCIVDEKSMRKINLPKNLKIFWGKKGLEEFSTLKSDISVMAISGISCLKPLFINLSYTKKIALANKESIVTAGSFIFSEAKRYNTQIIPIDSEINGLFQILSLKDDSRSHLNKIYITASGGSLFEYKKKDLETVKVEDVLVHPTWKMGRRITVDCATLVNKGFEVVEVHNFFNIPYEMIDIIIHRESKIHAMIEFKDSSIFACMYPADMRIPISYALYYPDRASFNNRINFKGKLHLSFQPVSFKKFPLLKIILEAATRLDNSLVILNASDEVAIDYFLKGKIKFTQIQKVLEYIFSNYPSMKLNSIEEVFYWDNWARQKTIEYLN